MKQSTKTRFLALALAMLLFSQSGFAFCGFYVSQAPADLFNEKSEVILVRDGLRTVITMSNDFQGDVKDFAMVVPVPVVLREDQIRIADPGIFDRLDAYSAPRLVAYNDENPCIPRYQYSMMEGVSMSRKNSLEPSAMDDEQSEADYQVKIEAKYTVGEYDIILLSAEQSDGLERWLTDNGYRIPSKAASVLEPYVKSKTKFFVVKVNLENHKKAGYQNLNPIQIEFESERFVLPIRLGMANARGAQDLVIYAFTRQGRVEPTNYRNVKVATDRDVPLFVERYFGEFYTDVFDRSYYREGMNAVFLEYAWNVSPMNGVKCDPCVSPPPVFNDFAQAGVNWANGMNVQSEVFFTRMHVRYTRDKFPQDLQFQVTPNRENFQARYVIHRPAQGDLSCAEGLRYIEELENRRRLEISELQALAGWTNPNYQDYIHEFSRKADKYSPQRNDFAPVKGLPGSDNNDGNQQGRTAQQWLFLIAGMVGLGLLAALRQAGLKQTSKQNV